MRNLTSNSQVSSWHGPAGGSVLGVFRIMVGVGLVLLGIISAHAAEVSKVKVFVDGSGSMAGFASRDGSSNTVYARSIEHLLGLSDAFFGADSEYYRLVRKDGSHYQRRDGRASIRDARLPSFYNGPTVLQDALAELSPGTLMVIVTDLFQSDADIGSVVDAIGKKLFSENSTGMAVGLMRVSAPFSGGIFHTGETGAFMFSGMQSFFLMFLGTQEAVGAAVNYMEKKITTEWKENGAWKTVGMPSVPGKTGTVGYDAIILSGQLVEPPASFASGPAIRLSQPTNISTTNSIDMGKERGLQFFVDVGPKSPVSSFQATLPAFRASRSMLVSGKNFRVATEAEVRNGTSWVPKADLRELLAFSLQGGFAQPIVSVKLNTAKLSPRATIRYRVDVAPADDDYRVPEWIERWNMDVTRTPEYVRDPASFPGTTLNLRLFVERLWMRVHHATKPRIGQFYLYYQSR